MILDNLPVILQLSVRMQIAQLQNGY